NPPTSEQSKALARQVMIELGLRPNDLASLQKMDWAKLNAAGDTAVRKINPPMKPGMGPFSAPGQPPRAGFGPTVDGRTITVRSFNEAAPEISKNIPMLM